MFHSIDVIVSIGTEIRIKGNWLTLNEEIKCT